MGHDLALGCKLEEPIRRIAELLDLAERVARGQLLEWARKVLFMGRPFIRAHFTFCIAAAFVPVANDGTWFSPTDCNKDGTSRYYYVATGDDEEKCEDYWLALDFLRRAKVPRWRYCDAAKRWRLKIGGADTWARKPRAEIDAMLRAVQNPEA